MSSRTAECIELQQLTKKEIDRRLGDLASCLFDDAREADRGSEPLRPHWITAAELIERVRPFLVMN